ncbi:MAG: hypothetical protein ACLR3R_18685 [Clostridium paraputrificum]
MNLNEVKERLEKANEVSIIVSIIDNELNVYMKKRKRLSSIETNLQCTLVNNSIKVIAADEIGYGEWYDLDDEDKSYYERFLNKLIAQ